MIECESVSRRFGRVTAVDNVTLRISGGVCALLGPNGAGKSTLLKVLTTLLSPDSGNVRICGVDIFHNPLQARRLIGVMPEDLGLFDSLTIEEHLELSGPIYGLTLHETRERAEQLLRLLGLSASRETFLDQASHGMRKKTALALALLHNPRVVFLDEPFEGIDPIAAVTIGHLLAAIAKRGVTVFLTSHTLPVVDRLANRILMIHSGRIVWDSDQTPATRPLEEIYSQFVEPEPAEDLDWLRSSS